MKKFAMSSLLALSSTLAIVGISQANAVDTTSSQVIIDAKDKQAKSNKKHGHHKQGKKKGGMNQGVLAQLDLTDAQKSQIGAIRQAQRTKHQSARAANQAEHEQRRAQMQALMNGATLDTATLNSLANAHAEHAKQRFIERTQTQHAIAQVLTAEQRAQLEQLHDERGERGGNR